MNLLEIYFIIFFINHLVVLLVLGDGLEKVIQLLKNFGYFHGMKIKCQVPFQI